MGTLFDQPPRRRFDDEVPTIAECADTLHTVFRTKPTMQDAVALYRAEIALARLRADIHDQDIKDEQLGDLGLLLSELNNILQKGLENGHS